MSKRSPRKLAVILGITFAIALVMGPGPGVELVNPGPNAEGPTPRLFGLPIVYAWGLIWFAVEAAVIVIAFFTLWTDDEPDVEGGDVS